MAGLAERIRFSTEATQVDTYKHRDLLLLGKAAGLRELWFGIEDPTATLVNKGQKPEMTVALFRMMRTLMDEVEFEHADDGTRLRMTKYLPREKGT